MLLQYFPVLPTAILSAIMPPTSLSAKQAAKQEYDNEQRSYDSTAESKETLLPEPKRRRTRNPVLSGGDALRSHVFTTDEAGTKRPTIINQGEQDSQKSEELNNWTRVGINYEQDTTTFSRVSGFDHPQTHDQGGSLYHVNHQNDGVLCQGGDSNLFLSFDGNAHRANYPHEIQSMSYGSVSDTELRRRLVDFLSAQTAHPTSSLTFGSMDKPPDALALLAQTQESQ